MIKKVLRRILGPFAVLFLAGSFAIGQVGDGDRKEESRCTLFLVVEFRLTGEIGEIERGEFDCAGVSSEFEEAFWKAAVEEAGSIEFRPPIGSGIADPLVKKVHYRLDAGQVLELVSNSEERLDLIKSHMERDLVIVHKPNGAYPRSTNGTVCIEGSVLLRATFGPDGNIGRVNVLKGLPYGFDESAIDAARKISFVPRMRGGIPESVNKVVVFNFTIY